MASFEEALVFIGTVLVGFFLARAVGLIAHLRRRAMIPRRCRVYKSHHFDSTIWDDFKVRDGDIIIATAYKSGTTWMQQIVSELLFKEGEGPNVAECSPWLDFGGMPREETLAMLDAQTHRRFIKTHLPATAMPYYPQAKYIYVGRDGRDAFMSLYNHYATGNDDWYKTLNDRPGRVGPPLPRFDPQTTPAQLFDRWLGEGWEAHPWESDGWPWWSLLYNFASWWEFRHLDNILFVHFANLKADLPGEMARIAAFLGVPVEQLDKADFDERVRHCTFEYMRAHGEKVAPAGGALWKAPDGASTGAAAFFHRGTNGRWKEALTPEQVRRYEETVRDKLTPEGAHWLATGEAPPPGK